MIPSPANYYSSNRKLQIKSDVLKAKQMKLAEKICANRAADDANFQEYCATLNDHLSRLSLILEIIETPYIDNDTPECIAPTVTYKLYLHGKLRHASTKNWQTQSLEKMKFLQDFLQQDCAKTISTMECINNLEMSLIDKAQTSKVKL